MSLATASDVPTIPTEKGRNSAPVLRGLYPKTVCSSCVRKKETAKMDPARPSLTK
jgi:hypothetical protein